MDGAAMGVLVCFAMSCFSMVYFAMGQNSLDEQCPAISQNRFDID